MSYSSGFKPYWIYSVAQGRTLESPRFLTHTQHQGQSPDSQSKCLWGLSYWSFSLQSNTGHISLQKKNDNRIYVCKSLGGSSYKQGWLTWTQHAGILFCRINPSKSINIGRRLSILRFSNVQQRIIESLPTRHNRQLRPPNVQYTVTYARYYW